MMAETVRVVVAAASAATATASAIARSRIGTVVMTHVLRTLCVPFSVLLRELARIFVAPTRTTCLVVRKAVDGLRRGGLGLFSFVILQHALGDTPVLYRKIH